MDPSESSSSPDTAESSPPTLPPASKKRKRDTKPLEELEVDVDAPEPPSKKALRKAKKGKSTSSVPAPKLVITEDASDTEGAAVSRGPVTSQRSEHGIWIGNLPWTASKEDLRKFLIDNAEIQEEAITRIHMPAPSQTTVEASRQRIKPQNKGFAYVDFSTEHALDAAVALSETLLSGRRVLIKNAKSFEGRPDPVKEDGEKAVPGGKPPSTRIFVGNLGFDTTKEELSEHFSRCGEVADAFVATFEDTGNCKGYAWVTFEDVESAKKAVRGWVEMEPEQESEDNEEDDEGDESREVEKPKKKPRVRKWWVNRIKGRALRMEFAEDKTTRYKKRYGKGGSANKIRGDEQDIPKAFADPSILAPTVNGSSKPVYGHSKPSHEREARPVASGRYEKKVDARTIKPGAALVGAQRLTGAMVPSQGKKITFD